MTPAGIAIRHYTAAEAAGIRTLLLRVYAEVYKDAAEADPFAGVERFAAGLDGWSRRPGWTCTVGYAGDEAVGYAYGAPLPPDAAWWKGLLTDVPPKVTEETGHRTYALSELMVRRPWRKTGAARALHDALLTGRTETRATLLVDQDHPRVRALYQSWGWTVLGDLRPRIPNAPLFTAMVIGLPLPGGVPEPAPGDAARLDQLTAHWQDQPPEARDAVLNAAALLQDDPTDERAGRLFEALRNAGFDAEQPPQ